MEDTSRTTETALASPTQTSDAADELKQQTWLSSGSGEDEEGAATPTPGEGVCGGKRRCFILLFALLAIVVAIVIAITTGTNSGRASSSSSSSSVVSPTPMPTSAPSLAPSNKPSDVPSSAPSTPAPSEEPTGMPSDVPSSAPSTPAPTQAPTTEAVPVNPVPQSPPRGYFNYDVNNRYGPDNWNRVDTSRHWLREFGPNGFGPWQGHVDFDPTNNICRSRQEGKKSPLNLSRETVECEATHEIRTEVRQPHHSFLINRNVNDSFYFSLSPSLLLLVRSAPITH